jgi:hypothetical protein
MSTLSSILLVINLFGATPASNSAPAAHAGPGPGGIYLSPEQFGQHTISYPFDCQTDKFRLNNFLGGAGIQLIRNGEKHSFAKDTIFGYRDCNGIDYRFYLKTAYRILDTAGFLLYSNTRLEQGSKIARPATLYFFSASSASPIQPLTIANLQKAFYTNPVFCYKLDSEFRSDAALITRLSSDKTYKLKHIYQQSTLCPPQEP